MTRPPPRSTLFPYTTLFRSAPFYLLTTFIVNFGTETLHLAAGILLTGTMLGAVLERSEEHTSELQSRGHLVCRLLLEKKKRHGTCDPRDDRHTSADPVRSDQ